MIDKTVIHCKIKNLLGAFLIRRCAGCMSVGQAYKLESTK